MSTIPYALVIFFLTITSAVYAAPQGSQPIKVGVASILSGDLGILGQNIVDTAETYHKHFARHKLEFYYEDAKLGSVDGLRAYQKLINVDRVDLIIGGCSSNGTMAAKSLINSSKTPTVTVVTGGYNIDNAGPYVFRIGNSDTLNGYQEAEAFVKAGIKRVALLTEETEYTQDIATFFREKFRSLGGELIFDENFVPGTTDFRTEVTLMKKSKPEGIFVPTQTGVALGVFLKQWHQQSGADSTPIHTTFVAAPNPDAHKIAGSLIEGVYYMAPEYDRENSRLQEFFKLYREDHGRDPSIPFHTAGTVDTLDLLQKYLDQTASFSKELFREFLLNRVKEYKGLMGTYSFDRNGNADLGFTLARISKNNKGQMK